MQDFLEFAGVVFGGLLAIIVFMVIVVGIPVNYLLGRGCAAQADKMSVPHEYTFATACMIKVRGKWIPMEQYRTIADESPAP